MASWAVPLTSGSDRGGAADSITGQNVRPTRMAMQTNNMFRVRPGRSEHSHIEHEHDQEDRDSQVIGFMRSDVIVRES